MFYPHFSVLSSFQRFIPISAFYPHFSFRFRDPVSAFYPYPLYWRPRKSHRPRKVDPTQIPSILPLKWGVLMGGVLVFSWGCSAKGYFLHSKCDVSMCFFVFTPLCIFLCDVIVCFLVSPFLQRGVNTKKHILTSHLLCKK